MRLLLRVWSPTGDLLLTDGPAVTLQDRETGETLRFVPGLEIDDAAMLDALAWLSDSLVPRSLPVTVLRAGGIDVEGAAEVARLLDDADDLADRQVVARGFLRDVTAESSWWSATVVEDVEDDRGLLLDEGAVVEPATWPRSNAQRVADGWPSYVTTPQHFDGRIAGVPYPFPIGIPGVQGISVAGTVFDDSAISGPALHVEYASIVTTDQALLAARGRIAATHLRHVSSNGSGVSYGERLPVQVGHDMRGRIVSLVQPTTSITLDTEHWLCYSEADGGGAPNPYGPGLLRRCDHVIRWALDRSTLRIDRRELPRLGALSSLLVDTVLTAQARPWQWLRSQVLPLLPVSVATGPRGLYLWPWIPALDDFDVEMTLRVGVNCERVAPWRRPALDMVSRVTVAYGLDARGGNLVRRYTLAGRRRSTDPPDTVGLDYWARRALDLVGEREAVFEAPIVCDDATAHLLARYQLHARSRPHTTATLVVQRDERLLPGALVRVVDTDPAVDAVAEVTGVRYTGDDMLAIDVRSWAQRRLDA